MIILLHFKIFYLFMHVYGNTNAMVCGGQKTTVEDSSCFSPCAISGLVLSTFTF